MRTHLEYLFYRASRQTRSPLEGSYSKCSSRGPTGAPTRINIQMHLTTYPTIVVEGVVVVKVLGSAAVVVKAVVVVVTTIVVVVIIVAGNSISRVLWPLFLTISVIYLQLGYMKTLYFKIYVPPLKEVTSNMRKVQKSLKRRKA